MILKALFAWFMPKPRVRKATEENLQTLIARIHADSIVVIGADIGAGMPLGDRSELVKITEHAAQRQVFDGAHKFTLDETRFLPIFSDAKSAKAFCGAYVDLLSRIHAFRLFRISGDVLAAAITDSDTIVLDAQSDVETEFSPELSQRLRSGLCSSVTGQAEFLSVALPIPGVTEEVSFAPQRATE